MIKRALLWYTDIACHPSKKAWARVNVYLVAVLGANYKGVNWLIITRVPFKGGEKGGNCPPGYFVPPLKVRGVRRTKIK